jgi:hypothetical protein
LEASTEISKLAQETTHCMAELGSLQINSKRVMCEVVMVKTKKHWRPQDVGDANNMEHLLRKAVGNEWSAA